MGPHQAAQSARAPRCTDGEKLVAHTLPIASSDSDNCSWRRKKAAKGSREQTVASRPVTKTKEEKMSAIALPESQRPDLKVKPQLKSPRPSSTKSHSPAPLQEEQQAQKAPQETLGQSPMMRWKWKNEIKTPKMLTRRWTMAMWTS